MPTTSDLKYKVDIVTASTNNDGYGSNDGSTLASNVWANVEDLSGLELIRSKKVTDKASHRVTIRYRVGVQAKMQVIYAGRAFDIEAVLDLGQPRRKVFLSLLCSELQTS